MSIRVTLDPPAFAIEPGRQVVCTVTVRNTGRVIERYSLAVVGTPAAWARLDPAAISLLPDTEREVTLTFHPPRQSTPHAGLLPFGVRVVPSDPNVDAVVEEGDITIQPFTELVPVLSPQTSRAVKTGRHRLHLTNAGNTPAGADVSASDPDQLLAFKIDRPHLDVPAGETETATIVARARQGKTLGAPEPRPFQVQIAPTDAPVITVAGTMLQRPLLPRWLPKAVIALVVLLLAGTVLASRRARVSDAALPGGLPTTTVAATTTTKATIASTTAAPTTTSTTGSAGTTHTGASGLEQSLSPQNQSALSCSPPYAQVVQSTSTASTTTTTGTASTSSGAPAVIFNVTLSDASGSPLPGLTFKFNNQSDAGLAQGILQRYSKVCVTGRDAILAERAMFLEPPASLPAQAPSEKCTPYSNSPLTLQAEHPDTTHLDAYLADTSVNPILALQPFHSFSDALAGRDIALAHKARCWVGGGSTYFTLDPGDGSSIVEYWR